jgi:2-dehydro-3-deoxyphosphogluconate aldolase/(4S)-4-hydroxy-2-oxoglutarate aldolase
MKKGVGYMNDTLKKIGDLGIVPVVKIDDAKDAVPLGKALLKGGLPVAEITFRTAAAEEAIKNITGELPDILVGAGTVLNVEQVKRAVNVGAKFIVSPGLNPSVVEYCVDNGIPITPGCSNPTDIEMALSFGLEVVKFFPAEAFGGLKTLKAISAPYGMIKFLPTGGINASNVNDYLSFSKVLACGGSWMVKDQLIKNGNFDEITRLTREAVNIMLGFDLAHIGINASDTYNYTEMSEKLATIFNFPREEGEVSSFIGTAFEVMKTAGRGKNGHIAIKTNNVSRAIAYLNRSGIEVDMSTVKNSPEGQPVFAYLANDIGGFAIHLTQNK